MERSEHKNIVTQILEMSNPDKQADVSELLTKLSEDYETVMTDMETARTNVSELTKTNETLRKVNTDLFLKVGTPAKAETQTNTNEIPEMNFENLFNEKGELI